MNANDYNQRGLCRRAQANEDGAYADFTESIRLSEGEPAPFYNRALLQVEQGRLDEALADFDQALLLNPREPDAITHRASTRSRLGDFAGALADCNKLVEIFPAQALAYLNRAIILFNHNELATALDDVTTALEFDPNDASTWELRGLIQRGMSNVQQALDDLSRAISLDPSSSEAYRHRAVTKRGIGEVTSALMDFRQAIRLESESKGKPLNPHSEEFVAGQCWEYDTPSGESGSRAHVLVVEEVGRMGTVVHVSISRLQSGNPKISSPHGFTIHHLPMAISALRKSVRRLDMDSPIPVGLDFSGYLLWHKSVSEGKTGAWMNPLKEIVPVVLSASHSSERGDSSKKASVWRFWMK